MSEQLPSTVSPQQEFLDRHLPENFAELSLEEKLKSLDRLAGAAYRLKEAASDLMRFNEARAIMDSIEPGIAPAVPGRIRQELGFLAGEQWDPDKKAIELFRAALNPIYLEYMGRNVIVRSARAYSVTLSSFSSGRPNYEVMPVEIADIIGEVRGVGIAREHAAHYPSVAVMFVWQKNSLEAHDYTENDKSGLQGWLIRLSESEFEIDQPELPKY